jgi:L-fuculose-phosphate aldolase
LGHYNTGENQLSTPFQTRSLMVEFGRRLYERNHIGAAEGNLSARLPDGRILITPSGANKGFMKAEDLILCDSTGKKVQGAGKPSSEIKLHTAIYNWRPDIFAICHAHPVYATAYSTARIPLMRPILAEVVGTIGGVPLAHYGAPGSSDLPETLAALIERYDAFLLEAHGVLTLGKSIEDAFNKIETIERFANVLFVAEQLGEVKDLPAKEIERLLKGAGRLNLKDELMTQIPEKETSSNAADIISNISPVGKKTGSAGYR